MPNKEIIGKEGPGGDFKIEKEYTIPFAQAIGDLNPLYIDEEAAKKSELGGLIAPPTFAVKIYPMDIELFQAAALEIAGLVHAGQEFEFFQPIRVGDTLTCCPRIADVYEKQGKSGTLDFIVFETTAFNDKNEKVLTGRMTLLSPRKQT